MRATDEAIEREFRKAMREPEALNHIYTRVSERLAHDLDDLKRRYSFERLMEIQSDTRIT